MEQAELQPLIRQKPPLVIDKIPPSIFQPYGSDADMRVSFRRICGLFAANVIDI